METFYLEKPSITRKAEAIEYINEFYEYKSEIHGVGGLNKHLEEETYENWLEENLKLDNDDYAKSKGLVPASTYFLIRKEDNKLVGMIDLRYYLNDFLLKFGGNIGYSIRPTERQKGYAKIQLYLCLLKAEELGIEKVLITASTNNIGSNKTIKSLGGEFENSIQEDENKILNRYWINIQESLVNNKDKYSQYI